jgi:serine/threonine-protein kinase ATR
MEVGELCDTAFQAWSAMTVALGSDDVEPLIDQTFSMVVRNWTSFSGETQDLAQLTIAHIFNHHSELLSDLADSIPSLGPIQELSQYEKEILRLKDGMDLKHQLHSFVRRCQNDNVAVVFQALTELVPLLRMNQDFLHQPSINELPDPVVPQLTRAVLDCCVKFSPDQPDIAVLCARCLGLIGCLDPNRIDATRVKKDILVLSNFSKADDTIEFILFFLQEILVNVFLSAPNTRVQGFLAFAMQELLKLCDLDSSVFYPSTDAHLNINYRRWLDLPELVRNTLTPFLTSRYTLKKGNFNTKCSYPLFHAEMSHYEWLQRLVLDMLQKANGENVELIFDICSRVIRYQDISIMIFLFPFTALNLVVSGTEQQRTELKQELMLILQFELPEDRQIRENIISCSEVGHFAHLCGSLLIPT